MPPRVPITWEADARAAGPALGAFSPLPDVGPHSENALTGQRSCYWTGSVETAAHARAARSEQTTKANATTRTVIAEIQRAGRTTLAAIAQELEARGVRTPAGRDRWRRPRYRGCCCPPNPSRSAGNADTYCIAMEISQPPNANEFHPVTAGRSGPGPDLGTVLPAGVSLLDGLRKRQGERVLVAPAGRRCALLAAPARATTRDNYSGGDLQAKTNQGQDAEEVEYPRDWCLGVLCGADLRCRRSVFSVGFRNDFNESSAVFAFIVGAAICGTVLFALVSAVRNAILRAK